MTSPARTTAQEPDKYVWKDAGSAAQFDVIFVLAVLVLGLWIVHRRVVAG